MDLTTATPVEIDTRIVDLMRQLAPVTRDLVYYNKCLHEANTYPHRREEARTKIDALRVQRDTIKAQMEPLEAEYRRRRWARYYRVQNNGGHVHNTTACRYTHRTTEFGWLPQVSGFTAEQVVEMAGRYTCLGCFPTVRAEILAERPCVLETYEQAQASAKKTAADAVKAAKAAEKAAKAITNPDGTPLRIKDYGGPIKTLRSAETEYTDQGALLERDRVLMARVANKRLHGIEVDEEDAASVERSLAEREEACLTLLTAIAHKLGTTVDEERTKRAKKVEARYKRDWSYR